MTQADYVVVGAGSAGCAVARRLAESGASVVLVEAGGNDDKGLAKMLFQTPGAISVMHSTPQLKKLFDWGYKSTPQKHAWDRTIPMTRGKVLGGSSSINGMLFVRGNRKNFDDWAAEGCKGWSFDDVLPAFKKLEDWEDGATELRGVQRPDQGHPQARPHRGRALLHGRRVDEARRPGHRRLQRREPGGHLGLPAERGERPALLHLGGLPPRRRPAQPRRAHRARR